ncbi:MFS transporter [Paenibacillus arenilitoris]|uniref:MFS transporter n=1 Tax=Paenibacillus arenilitoris TaxID=2772299 RepID=A0A927CIG3_9BACL|nr:MFS transporter [Paenibacillus arenilitoris]MBD2867672.1 MFS transporter [Paenibacillus arenilitoris]
MQSDKLWSAGFIRLCLSSFFLFFGFYMLATALSDFVTNGLGGTSAEAGLSMTVFIIAAVLLRPFAGRLMGRFGENKVVTASLFLFLLCSVAYFGVFGFGMLLLVRFLHGGAFAIATTSTNTAAIDLIPERRKGEGISYFSLFMSLAMVIGPFVGLSITAHGGFAAMFATCAACSLIAFALGASSMRSRKPERGDSAPQERRTAPAGKLTWSGIFERKAIPIGLSGFVIAFAYSGIVTFMSVYAHERAIDQYASYFFVCFGIMIVLPRPLIGKLLDRVGEHVIVYPSIAIFAAGMLLLSLASTPAMLLAAGAVIGLGYGALLPCFQTIAVLASPEHRRGLAIATFYVLFDLGYGIGSFALGSIASGIGYSRMYIVCSVVIALSAVLYFALHHRRKRAAAAAGETAYASS